MGELGEGRQTPAACEHMDHAKRKPLDFFALGYCNHTNPFFAAEHPAIANMTVNSCRQEIHANTSLADLSGVAGVVPSWAPSTKLLRASKGSC